MKSLGRAIAIGALLVLVPILVRAFPPERSVSTSRQFIVYGSDVRLRGAACDVAETVKRELLHLIGRPDTWSAPIVVNAHSAAANLPEKSRASPVIGQTGFGLRVQVDLNVDTNSLVEIRRELLKAILVEMSQRRTPDLPAGTTYMAAPDWLADGIEARISSEEWLVTVSLEKAFSLGEFLQLNADSLDAISRSLYRGYSAALIEEIVCLPDGRERLARYILDSDVPSHDRVVHFRKHFPEVCRIRSRLRGTVVSSTLSVEESELNLQEILNVRIPVIDSGKTFRLDEFPAFIRHPAAKRVLIQLRRDLRGLFVRAQPLYQPLIADYEKTAALISRGKTRGITERLSRLRESRIDVAARMRKVTDYMNWFEATKSNTPSGLFVGFMKAEELAESATERRHDPISVYLDVLETQFQE